MGPVLSRMGRSVMVLPSVDEATMQHDTTHNNTHNQRNTHIGAETDCCYDDKAMNKRESPAAVCWEERRRRERKGKGWEARKERGGLQGECKVTHHLFIEVYFPTHPPPLALQLQRLSLQPLGNQQIGEEENRFLRSTTL